MAVQGTGFARKLRPPQIPPNNFRRQALLDLLHGNIQKKLLTVVAPAGSGKTSLVANFVSEVDVPICWYSLDASDFDAHILAEGIISAVRSQFPQVGRQAQSALALTTEHSKLVAGPLNALTDEMAALIPDYLLFVIEDYQNVESDPDAKIIVDKLIESSPDNCHFIVTSRSPIRLPVLTKLAMRQQVDGIEADRFLLSKDDIRSLLSARQKKPLSMADAEAVFNETGGWIPAVLLHSFNSGSTEQMVAHRFANYDLFEYLASEVFQAQPPDVQEFLSSTAVLDELDPEFCDSLLGRHTSGVMLEDLCRRSLFTSRVQGEKPIYVYHPLLRDFLVSRLLRILPEHFLILHYKAGLLCEQDKRWTQAFDHFLAARRYREASRIVLDVGDEYIRSGRLTTVVRWVDSLPNTIVSAAPTLTVLKAGAMVHLGDSIKAARLLTEVLDSIEDKDWLVTARALSWRCAAFRMMSRFAEAKNDIRESIRLLTRNKGPASITGDAYRQLGDIYTMQGHFQVALRHEKAALKHYDSSCDLSLTSQIHNSLGIIYQRLGLLTKACFHFERAREGWQKLENSSALAMTMNNLGITYQRRGQYSLAVQTLKLALDKARQSGHKRTQAGVTMSMGETLRDVGLLQEALNCFQQGLDIAREIIEPYFVTYALIGMGEVHRLLGDIDRAEALEKDAVIHSEENKQGYEKALAQLQLGIIEKERGRFDTANEILSDCCKRLARAGDKPSLANAYFQMAHTALCAKRYADIRPSAEKVEAIAHELGYDCFLVAEYRKAILLIQFCITRKICGNFFSQALNNTKRISAEAREYGGSAVGISRPVGVTPLVEVSSFGTIAVRIDDRPVKEEEWKTKKAKELFLYLLTCETPRTREQITAAVWPELDVSKGSSNFHINLYRARRATIPVLLLVQDGRYVFNPEIRISFDAREFRSLLQQAKNGFPEEKKVGCLEKAVKLYKGPFAEDIYGDWVEETRRELEDQYIGALFTLADFHERHRSHSSAAELVEKIINCDPYNNRAYARLLEWQIAAKEYGSAHQTYQRYQDAVVRELHSSSPRVEELFHRIAD